VNIHITKHTRLQPWEGRTIFGDYPLHLRPGNFTVTLLFADADSIGRVHGMLGQMLAEIEARPTLSLEYPHLVTKTKYR